MKHTLYTRKIGARDWVPVCYAVTRDEVRRLLDLKAAAEIELPGNEYWLQDGEAPPEPEPVICKCVEWEEREIEERKLGRYPW